MRRAIFIAISLSVAVSLIGLVGFYFGTQAASEYWLRQYLRVVAEEMWVLERARCAMSKSALSADVDWIEHELRIAERTLNHEEYAMIVEEDPAIQRFRELISTLHEEKCESTDLPEPAYN